MGTAVLLADSASATHTRTPPAFAPLPLCMMLQTMAFVSDLGLSQLLVRRFVNDLDPG